MRVDFYKNREKLLKDGKYLLYEDDKIILFQDGKGYKPQYFLFVTIKESNTTERISPIHFSAKFFDYWDKYLADGIRKEDIKLELGKDFVTQKFSEKCKKENIWPILKS